jgi:DNA topoisomerase IB
MRREATEQDWWKLKLFVKRKFLATRSLSNNLDMSSKRLVQWDDGKSDRVLQNLGKQIMKLKQNDGFRSAIRRKTWSPTSPEEDWETATSSQSSHVAVRKSIRQVSRPASDARWSSFEPVIADHERDNLASSSPIKLPEVIEFPLLRVSTAAQ